MNVEGTKIIHGNPFGQLFVRPLHLVRSLYTTDVRKDATVFVNVENQVFRALFYVLVAVIVNKPAFVATKLYTDDIQMRTHLWYLRHIVYFTGSVNFVSKHLNIIMKSSLKINSSQKFFTDTKNPLFFAFWTKLNIGIKSLYFYVRHIGYNQKKGF